MGLDICRECPHAVGNATAGTQAVAGCQWGENEKVEGRENRKAGVGVVASENADIVDCMAVIRVTVPGWLFGGWPASLFDVA
jgi:hypothetical protein